MRIAIASGKGGTGKTTVATNLAYVASRAGHSVAYLDCDVEEPNGALFLHPKISEREPVHVSIPALDLSACTFCGLCGAICQYSAIVPLKDNVLIFPDLCHSCAGCWLVCESGALSESQRSIGTLEKGHAGEIQVIQGLLDIGRALSPPVIRAVKAAAPEARLMLIDAPPGTSCPVIESVRDADYVLLVTEPTPFGLHDLKLAVEMVRVLGLPFGVVVNRADPSARDTHAWCEQEQIAILAEIPDDRRVAEVYSRGGMASEHLPEYFSVFSTLLGHLESLSPAQASEAPRQLEGAAKESS
ncbi:MAG: P-loop NTPase [Candidatus Hydrogenedentales bacterium]|jgi:MinD superfamily P-loop ATPase